MRQDISEDESLLAQVFWFLLFLGWVPYLASYGFVLDPARTTQDGVVQTFTSTVTLYEQAPWGHPALGVLAVAAFLSLACLVRLKYRALWPVPVFLAISTQIHVFNEEGLGGPDDMTVHAAYAVFATWCSFLFLRYGHLLSPGFLGYVAVLVLDYGLYQISPLWRESPVSVLGLIFSDYTPYVTNILLFLATAVIARMLWLLVRDNRAFVRSLPRAFSGLLSRRHWPSGCPCS
jgi:hypothetical protein